MADRLRIKQHKVFYKDKIFCYCFNTNLCDGDEAAEIITALFNDWLDKTAAIDEKINQCAGKLVAKK